MKKINTYFLAGTLGILFTSMSQILLTNIFPGGSTAFLYPVFIILLVFGTGVMIKKKTASSGMKTTYDPEFIRDYN